MSVFYGINWLVKCEGIFEEWLDIWFLVLQQLSVRQSVKMQSKHLSMDLALNTKKV